LDCKPRPGRPVNVINGFRFKNCLRESLWNFAAVTDFISPALKGICGFGRSIHFRYEVRRELLVNAAGETEYGFGEFFFRGLVAAAALHLVHVGTGQRFERKVALTDEYGAGDHCIDGLEKSKRSGFQLEIADIHVENVSFTNIGIAEAEVTELAIRGVCICESETFLRDRNTCELLRDSEFQLKIRSAVQFHGRDQWLETLFGDADGVFSGAQIGRGKFAGVVRSKNDRLRDAFPGDLDTCAGHDGARRVFDGAGDRIRPKIGDENEAKEREKRNTDGRETAWPGEPLTHRIGTYT